MGGTGKTPTVEWVARLLRDADLRVAVLSRGYRGGHEKEQGVVSDGETLLLSQAESGDEPYLLARRLKNIPVLVGRNRCKSGKLADQRFHTQVAVLDDGYQHMQLERDLNILLVDGREGFSRSRLFPLGSLREPLKGLSRADKILITKAECQGRVQEIEETLRKWNSHADIFYGRYLPEYLLDPMTGERDNPHTLTDKRVLAFAGLASPEYFFETLESLGANLVGEIVFPDHHQYTERDLEIIRGTMSDAEWCVTTEKDLVRMENLNMVGLSFRVLEIRIRISNEATFKKAILAALNIDEAANSN